jgi:hypothetical protein
MSYVNYKSMPGYIMSRVPFEGNSVTGKKVGNEYHVYSYNTLILRLTSPGEWWLNAHKYSQTTSKLQNIIHRSGIPVMECGAYDIWNA